MLEKDRNKILSDIVPELEAELTRLLPVLQSAIEHKRPAEACAVSHQFEQMFAVAAWYAEEHHRLMRLEIAAMAKDWLNLGSPEGYDAYSRYWERHVDPVMDIIDITAEGQFQKKLRPIRDLLLSGRGDCGDSDPIKADDALEQARIVIYRFEKKVWAAFKWKEAERRELWNIARDVDCGKPVTEAMRKVLQDLQRTQNLEPTPSPSTRIEFSELH